MHRIYLVVCNILFRPFGHVDVMCTWYLLTQYGFLYGILNTDVFAHESFRVRSDLIYVFGSDCVSAPLTHSVSVHVVYFENAFLNT